MRYSLLSRFQGALLGAALGGRFGFECQAQRQLKKKAAMAGNLPLNQATLQNQQLERKSQPPGMQSSPLASGAGKLAAYYAEKLIRQEEWSTLEGEPENLLFAAREEIPSQSNREQLGLGAELAIATLPIALFFHDDEIKLRQMIEKALGIQGHSELEQEALAIGFAIAQALMERLDPLHLIPCLITYLQAEATPSATAPSATAADLIDKLEQTQILLQERSSLHTALKTLLPSSYLAAGNGAIALALFCFLSTPEDLHLAVCRAARAGNSARIVSALTGALSGAYNSRAGIPLEWGLGATDQAPILDWQISASEVCQLATRLLAGWSGAYDPAISPLNLVIAAPGVIRPHSA